MDHTVLLEEHKSMIALSKEVRAHGRITSKLAAEIFVAMKAKDMKTVRRLQKELAAHSRSAPKIPA